jgi:hypothetical protein
LVASGKDGLFSAGKFVSWGDVADRGMKPHGVVVFDEASDQTTGLLEVQGDAWGECKESWVICVSVRSSRCFVGSRARCAHESD